MIRPAVVVPLGHDASGAASAAAPGGGASAAAARRTSPAGWRADGATDPLRPTGAPRGASWPAYARTCEAVTRSILIDRCCSTEYR